MVKIRIKRGMDLKIPAPAQEVAEVTVNQKTVALDLTPFSKKIRIRANVKVGDKVKIGQTLAHDTNLEKRHFISPGGGTVCEINRGEKRRLHSIVIGLDDNEEKESLKPLPTDCDKNDVKEALFKLGVSPFLKKRPFDQLISEHDAPTKIFIKATASAPHEPPPKVQLNSESSAFQKGIDLLSKIAPCQLVAEDDKFDKYTGATIHKSCGPHPSGLPSTHIERVSKIKSVDDCIWTIDIIGVASIGATLGEGRYLLDRNIALSGPGIFTGSNKFYKTRCGGELNQITKDRLTDDVDRVISGNVLTGSAEQKHLGFYDTQVFALSKPKKRRLVPFIRLFSPYFTSHKTYLSKKQASFSTRTQGEKRAFVDGALYQKVMPLNIPVEALVKSVMAKDYEMALQLGLLDVAPEDFALCEFICPSKIPFMQIIEDGISEYLQLYQS